MDKDNFENIITKQELIEIIEEEVDKRIKRIKEEGIDANEIAKIAEDLKREGILAGDELNKKALKAYRKKLIEEEIKKRIG
jgi:hypothetical protein